MKVGCVPLIELMGIWGELVECYHGVNGFGGDTAEIYAYRLCASSPSAANNDERRREDAVKARDALVDLCETFEREWSGVRVLIQDRAPQAWAALVGDSFSWRTRVRVERIPR